MLGQVSRSNSVGLAGSHRAACRLLPQPGEPEGDVWGHPGARQVSPSAHLPSSVFFAVLHKFLMSNFAGLSIALPK